MPDILSSLSPPRHRRLSRAPLTFRLGHWLTRHGLRGGHRLQEFARSRGWLDGIVSYRLPTGLLFDVPLFRETNCWTLDDVLDYESDVIAFALDSIRRANTPFTLIDCGADIGTFSVLCAAGSTHINRIVAIEPNPEAYHVLFQNISRLHLPTACHNAAVSDYQGRADLIAPAYDSADHAKYIVDSPAGDICVMRIDDLNIPHDYGVFLKVDVEGEELNVLRGASALLQGASTAIVIFEANREVATRTKIDPIDSIRQLAQYREWTFGVTELPGSTIDFDVPFFEQYDGHIFNIACVSI